MILLFLMSFVFASQEYPDVNMTPGSFCSDKAPDFTEYRYQEKIPYCARNVSVALKDKVANKYGVSDRSKVTIDHLIPLALGGSNLETNLWPEPKNVKCSRYNIENKLYLLIRDGKISRDTAVEIIKDLKFGYRSCP